MPVLLCPALPPWAPAEPVVPPLEVDFPPLLLCPAAAEESLDWLWPPAALLPPESLRPPDADCPAEPDEDVPVEPPDCPPPLSLLVVQDNQVAAKPSTSTFRRMDVFMGDL
jgi:hypothetical protein